MITNLVASLVVVLATNLTERVSQHEEPSWGGSAGDLVYHFRMVNDEHPTEKWIDHSVVATTYFGDFISLSGTTNATLETKNPLGSQTLTNWTEHFVLKQDWQLDTNNVEINSTVTFTNGDFITNLTNGSLWRNVHGL